jgi:hypothetical protein
MTRKRQSLSQWDDERQDPVERFQSPVVATLDEISKEMRHSHPSSYLRKSNSYHSYEDPEGAALDEIPNEMRHSHSSTYLKKHNSYHSYEDPEEAAEGLDFEEPLRREGSAQSLLEPVLRVRETLRQQAIDSLDGMSSVADDPPIPEKRFHSSANDIPQPNIIPTRLPCLTAYYRNGQPHKPLNMHQIKKIPKRRDRMNEYGK